MVRTIPSAYCDSISRSAYIPKHPPTFGSGQSIKGNQGLVRCPARPARPRRVAMQPQRQWRLWVRLVGTAEVPQLPDTIVAEQWPSLSCQEQPCWQLLSPTTECKLATGLGAPNVPVSRTVALDLKRACPHALIQLAQLPFRLLKPVGHAHFAVHRHRGGEVVLCLLAMAPPAVKFGETEVAVGNERAYAAGLS